MGIYATKYYKINRQNISVGELVVKAQYLCSMQENTNWYWKQQSLQQNIIVQTCKILHPCLDAFIITDVQDIHTFLFNSKCSILELLCTLARLCEGTPLQPLRLDFLSHPRSTLQIDIFRRHDNRIRGKSQRPSARSATQPSHYHDIAPLPTS